MPKCLIDGREAEFTPGENLIDVAKRVGIEIPAFCYHPALKVVGQCRMCAVEIEKMPKLQTACSTPAAEGMIVKTTTERVRKHRAAVMEFLLANHPLDCAICDQAGECDLQDFAFKYGEAYSRYSEERRTYVDLDMGPVIKKNMNRCIHCTRCLRFASDVAGIHEMVATKRGAKTEISTLDGKPLMTAYAGNYADLCPVGSLTLKDFRFKKRAWLLKSVPSVCEGCSRGCNVEIHHEQNVVYRCLPRENLRVNRYWICDEGRLSFHYIHDSKRVLEPVIREEGELKPHAWIEAVTAVSQRLKGAKNPAVIIGSDLTLEEAQAIKSFVDRRFPKAVIRHFGTPGVVSTAEDQAADRLLKRTSKTSNLHGLEKLGFAGFKSFEPTIDALVVFRGGRAVLPPLPAGKSIRTIGIGVFNSDEVARFDVVLPGLGFAEKDGTVLNFEGCEQKFQRAIAPPGRSKAISEILELWPEVST